MPSMRLPVPLTDADRLKILADISAAQTALESVEAEKKLANSGFNAKIKAHKASVHSLNQTNVLGAIYRDVEIEVRPDAVTGKQEVWRLDTNTLVKKEDMDPDERQLRLNTEVEEALSQVRVAKFNLIWC